MELLKNLEGMSADEQMTAVVELQKAAMKNLEDQKQASIGKSAELVIQGLKKIKSDFEAKFDSLNYDIQTKVASLKDGEQGLQGAKGEQGDRGLDGSNGRDGRDGKDGKDGLDGVDGVGVRDAKIDFDGSLVISLTDGREINCGEVVSVDIAKQIQKVTHNIQTGSGGDSQTVLDAIAALQATIATYGTMATQNKTSVDIEGGTIDNTTVGATTPSTGVFTTLTAQNETLKGTGQNLFVPSNTFTSLNTSGGSQTVTGSQSDPVGGSTAYLVVPSVASTAHALYSTASYFNSGIVTYTISVYVKASGYTLFYLSDLGSGGFACSYNLTAVTATPTTGCTGTITSVIGATGWYRVTLTTTTAPQTGSRIAFTGYPSGATLTSYSATFVGDGTSGVVLYGAQLEIGSTANSYIATTGSAVYGTPTLSFSGVASIGLQSDGSLYETSAGTGNVRFYTNNIAQEQMRVSHTASAVNYVQVTGAATGANPTISTQGSDANRGLTLSTKGTHDIILTTGGTAGWIRGQISAGSGEYFRAQSSSATPVNYTLLTGTATGISPSFSVAGSDTNIDLNLTTKGTGSVNLNTGNGNALRVADFGGTIVAGLGVFAGSSSQNTVYLSPYGSVPNGNLIIAAKGSQFVGIGTNTNNNSNATEQVRVTHTASAVNYVQVTGAATGTGPSISTQGSDTDITARYSVKGWANHEFYTGNGGYRVFQISQATATPVNYLQTLASGTGVGLALTAVGSDTNIPLVLQPKGTGALQAQQTDSTATGGNARGANAVDWQTSRSAASSVASGANAVVGGGASNGATGQYSGVLSGVNSNATGFATVISGGWNNSATGGQAVLVGGYSNTSGGPFNFVGGGASNSGTANAAVTTQSATMNGTTAVTLSGSNASIKVGQQIVGTSIASFTYVAAISGTSLTLSQAASGSSTSTLSFYTPHGVVVGGGNNQATGSYSFIGGGGDAGTAANRNVASGDWSAVVGGLKNTATASAASVSGGYGNTASGIASFVGGGGLYGEISSAQFAPNTASGLATSVVGGFNNTASANGAAVLGSVESQATGFYSAILGGSYGTTRGLIGNIVFPAGNNPLNSRGGAQAALLVLAVETTNATATVLRSNTSAAGTANQVILPNNSAYYFRGEVVSGVTGGGNTKGWFIEGVIKRGANAASTALVGTPTVTSSYADAGASTWTIAVTADTTNGGLAVTFTGQASTTIRTVAQIRTTEMTY